MVRGILIPFAAAFLLGSALPAAADRAPEGAERERIESALRDMGYEEWNEIEVEDDDNEIEVDDARHSDGKVYDLELSADDFSVIERDED